MTYPNSPENDASENALKENAFKNVYRLTVGAGHRWKTRFISIRDSYNSASGANIEIIQVPTKDMSKPQVDALNKNLETAGYTLRSRSSKTSGQVIFLAGNDRLDFIERAQSMASSLENAYNVLIETVGPNAQWKDAKVTPPNCMHNGRYDDVYETSAQHLTFNAMEHLENALNAAGFDASIRHSESKHINMISIRHKPSINLFKSAFFNNSSSHLTPPPTLEPT